MEHTLESRHKSIVVCAAILLHLLSIGPLLISDWTTDNLSPFPRPDVVELPHEAPVIFQNPTNDQQWAAMKARASRLGSSEHEDSIAIASADSHTNTDDDQEQAATAQAEPEALQVYPKEATRLLTDVGPSTPEEKKEPTKTSSGSATKRAAAKQLAQLAQGYLEQLRHEGENMVNLIGGDPTKKPSLEQLKYERYWAKIQWCIQNSLAIHRDRYVPSKAIRTSLKVFFSIARDGKIKDLYITQSSGYRDLDDFMLYAFKDASSSFPPLPTFISQDIYPVMYTIDVFSGDDLPWYAYQS